MAERGLYSIEFFDLQLRFAARAAELSNTPFDQAVGEYTNLYVRLGMGPRLDATDPDWRAYLDALTEARDPAAWTHEVHRRRMRTAAAPAPGSRVGCFSLAPLTDGLVRLHFDPGEQPGESPLAAANQPLRRRELATLLAGLKATHGARVRIVGASWLYNLAAYRRLFPRAYLESLTAAAHPYQRLPLWGQFLHRDRSVRGDVAARFLADVAGARDLAALGACFPFSVLATTAPARWLYDHTGV